MDIGGGHKLGDHGAGSDREEAGEARSKVMRQPVKSSGKTVAVYALASCKRLWSARSIGPVSEPNSTIKNKATEQFP